MNVFTFKIISITLTTGDVGGVLGLFLGASAFTIIEFGQFFVFALAKWCFNSKGGAKKKEKKKKNLSDLSNTRHSTIEIDFSTNLPPARRGTIN